VLARDRYTCTLALPGCEHRAPIVDHVIARHDGGPDTMQNLRAVCWACHNRRHPERGGAN
jgi:5-methylcytosine-specific restriction endonuclease McrA